MASSKSLEQLEPVSGFFGAGKSRTASDVARSVPAVRPAKPATARSRIEAARTKSTRQAPMGPTPERLAKGDIDLSTGMHRSIPPLERLRDAHKLGHDARENQALFEAGQKLNRHFQGCMKGVQAQDLNKIIGSTATDDLDTEEAWVHHRDAFRIAIKLMGWNDINPHRGCGRIVVAVVCEERSIRDAAMAHLPTARLDTMQATAMDRLREGLFTLAIYWRFL